MGRKRDTRTLIILGAGASVEFLYDKPDSLSTDTITHLFTLKTEMLYEKLQKYYTDQDINQLYQVKNLIFMVIASLRKFLNHFNYEHIVHLIDLAVDLYAEKHRITSFSKQPHYSNLNFALLDLFDGRIESIYGSIFNFLPIAIRNFILDYIRIFPPAYKLDLHRKSDKKLWLDFINSNLAKGKRISIYSLNYDSLIFDLLPDASIGGRIHTGFDLNIAGNQSSDFDPALFIHADNIYAPIHGSVHFCPGLDGLKFYKDPYRASEAREKRITSLETSHAGASDYNVTMITGLSKSEAILKPPYSLYYWRLMKDAYEADRVIIMGYSGADRHINSVLSSPIMAGKPYYVVDYKPDAKRSRFEYELQGDFFYCQKFIPSKNFRNTNGRAIIDSIFSINHDCRFCVDGARYALNNVSSLLRRG